MNRVVMAVIPDPELIEEALLPFLCAAKCYSLSRSCHRDVPSSDFSGSVDAVGR
jgi:hypothetical protein